MYTRAARRRWRRQRQALLPQRAADGQDEADPQQPACARRPRTFRGKPRGAAAEGIARELSGAEAERAFELIKSNWGAVMRPCERGLDLLGVPEVYVEVVPVAQVEDAEEVSGRSGMAAEAQRVS